MAGTQELDRLLEELRLTSMNLASGLPPPGSSSSRSSYASQRQHSTQYSTMYPTNKPYAPRSTSAMNMFSPMESNSFYPPSQVASSYSSYQQEKIAPYNHSYQPSFQNHSSSYQTECRTNEFVRSPQPYRPNFSPLPNNRHHTTYKTVLKQRPPVGPRQYSQVHLTIDPNCGTAETMHNTGIHSNQREQRLESELQSARQELARLRRAVSLVEERQRQASQQDISAMHGTSMMTQNALNSHPTLRSPNTGISQFSNNSTSSYHVQNQGTRSSFSTFQRNYPRQEPSPFGGEYPITKRSVSHTNIYGPRTWNLRSTQGSESDLSYRRHFTTIGTSPSRYNYSAHRERLRQEREQKDRARQLASSTTGLNVQHRNEQKDYRYRSLSAVNRYNAPRSFEEVETIVLQPIGRGVQDIDRKSRNAPGLHTKNKGGSLVEGLNRDDSSHIGSGQFRHQNSDFGRHGLASSTQYINRNASNTSLARPIATHQSQIVPDQSMTMVGSQPGRSSMSNNMNNQTNGLGPIGVQPVREAEPISPIDANLALVQESVSQWYQPNLSREAAINILRQRAPGSFLIRKSTTYNNSFGLAVKVAHLPPKVQQRTDDLQSELVRHYLIEVVSPDDRGVRLKGFNSEPVFNSLAELINQHTLDPLALPCRLVLPPSSHGGVGSINPSSLPPIVVGTPQQMGDIHAGLEPGVRSSPFIGTGGELDVSIDGILDEVQSSQPGLCGSTRGSANQHDPTRPIVSSTVPFVCVLRDSPTNQLNAEPTTFKCFILGFKDSQITTGEHMFAQAINELIPSNVLNAADCDTGISPVRYSEVQLEISPREGVTIADLTSRVFLRRHLHPDAILFSAVDDGYKQFLHPVHARHGMNNPKIFGIVSRKNENEGTTYVFCESTAQDRAESIVKQLRDHFGN